MAAEDKTLAVMLINSPEALMIAAVKATGGAPFMDGTLELLNQYFETARKKTDPGASEGRVKVLAWMFWSGAFLGLRIANKRYIQRLKLMAFNQGIDPITGKKLDEETTN